MEKFINYTIAKLAREKGFNLHCDWRYDEQKDIPTLINWKDEAVNEFFKDTSEIGLFEHYSKYLKENYYDVFKNDDEGYYCSAPTKSELNEWLMKEHFLHVNVSRELLGNTYSIEPFHFDNEKWNYSIDDLLVTNEGMVQMRGFDLTNSTPQFKSYQEAFEAGLQKALELI